MICEVFVKDFTGAFDYFTMYLWKGDIFKDVECKGIINHELI